MSSMTRILIASAFAALASNRVASADPHHDGGGHHGYHDDGWGAGHDAGHGHHGDDHPIYVDPGHHGDHDDWHWVDDDHDHAIDDHWDVHHAHRTSGHRHAAYWSPGAWRWDGAELVGNQDTGTRGRHSREIAAIGRRPRHPARTPATV